VASLILFGRREVEISGEAVVNLIGSERGRDEKEEMLLLA